MVEVCADEMQPLLVRGLIRPLDPAGIRDFDELELSDSDEIRNEAGEVLFVPASAGPARADRQHRSGRRAVDSYTDLFDPAVRRQGGDRVELADRDRGRPRWRSGMDDPMNLSPDQIDEVKEYLLDHRDQFRDFAESDASMVNLFKSGEVVIADGGRGTTEAMIRDGVPAEWIAPKEGVLSWVCGLAITSDAQNIDAAYKLINYYASPAAQAIGGESGFVVMNPKALALMPPEYRETADPATLDTAIPETEPTAVEALRPRLAGGGGRMSDATDPVPVRSTPTRAPRRATGRASGSGSAAACRGSRACS